MAWLERLAARAAPRLLLLVLAPEGELLGRIGERLAERELARSGWRTLGRRLKTPEGELDLFCLEPAGRPVAVEVKTGWVPSPEGLPDPLLRPGRRFGRRDLARCRRASRFAARHLCGGGARGRVDLVEVLVARRARLARVAEGGVRFLHHADLARPPIELCAFRRDPEG
jgi:hypothetical protein